MDQIEFAEYIGGLRDKRITRKEMATKWPWHLNTIRGYEKGERLPDVDYLLALSIETGADFVDLIEKRLMVGVLNDEHYLELLTNARLVDPDEPLLVLGQQTHIKVNNLDAVCEPGNSEYSFAPKKVKIPLDWVGDSHLGENTLATFKIADDSMEPTIIKEAHLLIDTSKNELQNAQVFALRINNDIYIKRVHKDISGGVVLLSDNSKYPPINLEKEQLKEIKVVGRVISSNNPI
ncbi:XRE family transcriptional regulator [Neptunicella sp. SCSIO 80796]|uniref:XRE family transcriptional regulator n=1 Tax=Neptunicella plasticusilytica TaxID=3117012 RepID=UPI003A4E6174